MATGFPSQHAMIDSTFLIICFLDYLKFHFTSNHHFDLQELLPDTDILQTWYDYYVSITKDAERHYQRDTKVQ